MDVFHKAIAVVSRYPRQEGHRFPESSSRWKCGVASLKMENPHFSSINEESSDTIDRKNHIVMTPTCQALSISCETNNNSAPWPSGAGEPHAYNDSGRERLRRFREDVAGRVPVPDTWGHENMLREWTDCSSFDKVLAPSGIASAREALVAEARCRATSQQPKVKRRR